MIAIKIIVLIIIGLAAGNIVAGGVSALITSVGIITKITYKLHEVKKTKVFETVLLLGAVSSYFTYIYMIPIYKFTVLPYIILTVIGFFMGIFVGCLAMSLAEALDVSTIYFRRIKFNTNIRYIIFTIAVGKIIGNAIYFAL